LWVKPQQPTNQYPKIKLIGFTLYFLKINFILYDIHNISNFAACDIKMKNSLEGIVIKWANQIGEVLKEQSTCLFKDNKHPAPSDEYEFWYARMKNLENIYTQLRDPRVKQVGRVLELIDSSYFPSFHATFKNVVAALLEAQDVTLHLKPLVCRIDKFRVNQKLSIFKVPKFIWARIFFSALLFGPIICQIIFSFYVIILM
jgi:hypothetical protein